MGGISAELAVNGLVAAGIVVATGIFVSLLIRMFAKAGLFWLMSRLAELLGFLLKSPVSWSIGLRWRSPRLRYFHMLAALLAIMTAAILGPFWVSMGAAVLSILVIATVYVAWSESELDQAANTEYSQRRFVGDFRDEAAVWIVSLFLVAPTVFARLDETYGILNSGGNDWLYFGVSLRWAAYVMGELVRAIPIFDLFEVYGLDNPSGITPVSGLGQHVTFALRILYDLTIVGAIIRFASIYRLQKEGRDLRVLFGLIDVGPDETLTVAVKSIRRVGATVTTLREGLHSRIASPNQGIRYRAAVAASEIGVRFEDTGLLEAGILAYESVLATSDADAEPFSWARTQSNLGIALVAASQKQAGAKTTELLTAAIAAYRAALEIWTRSEEPTYYAKAQNNLGIALLLSCSIKGEEREKYLHESISAIQEALEVWDELGDTSNWARALYNISSSELDFLASREIEDQIKLLNDAIPGLRKALAVWKMNDDPYFWAGAQRSLGGALATYAEYCKGKDRVRYLKEAVVAIRASQSGYNRVNSLTGRAIATRYLGSALASLAEFAVGFDRAHLVAKSIHASRNALKLSLRETAPYEWAAAQNNLALALAMMAKIRKVKFVRRRLYREALSASRSTMEVWSRDDYPEHWGFVSSNCGNTLYDLAHIVPAESRRKNLEGAISAHRGALEVNTREAAPQYWATSQNSLCTALMALSRLSETQEKGLLLSETVEGCRKVLEVWTLELAPFYWAMAQNNLGMALTAIAETKTGSERDKLLDEAIQILKFVVKFHQEYGPSDGVRRSEANLDRGLALRQGNLDAMGSVRKEDFSPSNRTSPAPEKNGS